MAQHDYVIANQSGAAFRADLNNGLAAIVSQNSGAAEPSTTYAYQWWADTTAGLLKIRNAANNGWITIGTLASANLGLLPLAGGILTGDLTLNAQSDLRLADSDSSNWIALQAPATITSNATFTLPAADGAADEVIGTNGAGALSFVSRSRLVLATSVASTSGASISFTSIPSWVKRLSVILNDVSTTGVSSIIVQLGTGGGPTYKTSGYAAYGVLSGNNSVSGQAFTTGFALLSGPTAADGYGGIATFDTLGSNLWSASSNIGSNTGQGGFGGGYATLSAALTAIRVTTVGGTDTFDSGTITILYEG